MIDVTLTVAAAGAVVLFVALLAPIVQRLSNR